MMTETGKTKSPLVKKCKELSSSVQKQKKCLLIEVTVWFVSENMLLLRKLFPAGSLAASLWHISGMPG